VGRARLSIGAYAETAPIDTNETPEGRARNRRVDIIVLNDTGILGEPGSHVAGAAAASAAR
jgi:chemotaxis protein MotB